MDDAEETAPMAVKAMPVAARKRAVAAAAKQGQTMAEWLSRAIAQLADREASEGITLPANRVEPPQVEPQVLPTVSPTELEGVMRAALAVSQAAGVPVPRSAARHAFALLTAQMRQARGMAPVKRRGEPSSTQRQIGKTIEG